MSELIELKSSDDLNQVWENSKIKPVLLFKHSTTCPISAKAFAEYNHFLESSEHDVDSYMVKVIEDRSVSNQIAEKTSVKHESPQLFLIRNKEVIWHTSHGKITQENIKKELASV